MCVCACLRAYERACVRANVFGLSLSFPFASKTSDF